MPNLPCIGGQWSEINSIQLVSTWYFSKDTSMDNEMGEANFVPGIYSKGMACISFRRTSKGKERVSGRENPERHRNLASLLANLSSDRWLIPTGRSDPVHAVSAHLQCASDPQEVSYSPAASRLTDRLHVPAARSDRKPN